MSDGYWTLAELAEFLQCSRWTVQRRVKADSGFPVLYGYGGPRFPIERTKAYLQRQESGRGRAYKSRRFLLPGPQLPVISNGAGSEPVSWAVQCADSLRKRLTTPWDRVVP